MSHPALEWAGRALRLVTHNFVWKLIALAGATLIWVLVSSEPELSTFTTVRLAFRNLPADIDISSSPMETVSLELRGPASELRGTGESRRPAVVLDMADVRPGERTYQIDGDNVNLPRGVHLVRSVPSEVRFEFERRATRQIAVEVRFAPVPQGYKIATYSVAPEKVEIEGPASHVARVRAALTDMVDVLPKAGAAQIRVNAFVPDPYVRIEQTPQVLVTMTINGQETP